MRSFAIPTVMHHGLGAVAALPQIVQELGLRRPMIVTDPGIVCAGLLERITQPLSAARQDYVVWSEVVSNSPIALVDRGARV